MSEVETPVQDELSSLKARADLLGIKYHPSISLEKLREKVNGVVGADSDADKAEAKSESERRAKLQKDAAALVRIRVTCMNPAKKEWEGEIFTVGNSVIGTFKKYVPFNADEGWHVPHVIYEQIKARECQVFYTEKSKHGVSVRKGKLIKEFAVEVLDPLTEEELKELAQRQAMARSID